jgi:asparagine synthase (glutamine-hydrolysing)
MCGIAGVMSRDPVPELEGALHRMLAALRHRGPDDSGCEAASAGDAVAVVLGCTRLAIQDTSPAGHQPMLDPETGNWILLNGEIYNHLDLRPALGDVRWRSRSDTETVLKSYAKWGEACLDRLKGMFALAIWDRAEGSLWCARDRLGIKPFYFSAPAGRFVFASEVRALLASGLVARRLDRRGLAGFVRFGSVPEPLTLVDGVRSLGAGEWMRVREGRVTETRDYWRVGLVDRPEPGDRLAGPGDWLLGAPAANVEADLRERLVSSIREHLLADVPVASFLSGGVDSAVVTALAAAAGPAALRTFTVGFAERELDESAAARAVALRLRTDHSEVRLADGEAASLAPEAVRALDLPSADGLNTWVVARAVAGQGVKVVLSGLGGDELFGGYPTFRQLALADRWSPLIGLLPARVRGRARRGGSGERAAEMTARGVPLVERYDSLRAFWSRRELESMGLDPAIGLGAEDPGPGLAPATRISALELSGYLRSTLLRDADAMSMAHSLELRVPLLDHELVLSCLRNGAAGRAGRGYKALLKRAASDVLPAGTARGGKRGFVLPMDRWMRGALRPFMAAGLAALDGSRALPAVDTGALLCRFESRRLSWARPWALAVLGHWLDRHRLGP